MLPSSRTASGRILSAKDLLASSATGSARVLSREVGTLSQSLSLLWRNVETVHRTVSLSLSALLRNFFAPISGSSPSCKRKKHCKSSAFSFGGEGGTRTLAPVSRPTPLAGAPRHQLEYFSMWCRSRLGIFLWRRERDSNPRLSRVTSFQD